MEHLETKSCACQSNVIPNTHQDLTDTQVLLEPFSLTDLQDSLAPNTVFVSEMAAISGWSQAEGLFWTCKGANRARKECMGREETWVSHRGPEWEAERGRARRSGIIRSLCGPLKRLRRKPTDGPSAPRHLGKGDTRTHTHTLTYCTPEGCRSESRQKSDSGHRCIWKKERRTDRKAGGWLNLNFLLILTKSVFCNW